MQDLSRFQHPRFARTYKRMSERADPATAELRGRLLAGLTGRVLEIGAGNGLNFPHYPAGGRDLVAVAPARLRPASAAAAAAGATVPVAVVPGPAGARPAGPGSYAAVVLSLVLCSVPVQVATLAEARRLLGPGGELRFIEYVRSP